MRHIYLVSQIDLDEIEIHAEDHVRVGPKSDNARLCEIETPSLRSKKLNSEHSDGIVDQDRESFISEEEWNIHWHVQVMVTV